MRQISGSRPGLSRDYVLPELAAQVVMPLPQSKWQELKQKVSRIRDPYRLRWMIVSGSVTFASSMLVSAGGLTVATKVPTWLWVTHGALFLVAIVLAIAVYAHAKGGDASRVRDVNDVLEYMKGIESDFMASATSSVDEQARNAVTNLSRLLASQGREVRSSGELVGGGGVRMVTEKGDLIIVYDTGEVDLSGASDELKLMLSSQRAELEP